VATALLLAGCVSPAVNGSGYRGKVQNSAKKMVGIIDSAQLAASLDVDRRMISQVTDDVVSKAETDAQSVLASLDSVQPPDDPAIGLRSRADDVLQPAASELANLRIAVRRQDRATMRSTVAELGRTLRKVQQLQDSV
jgi:hypothetical protein